MIVGASQGSEFVIVEIAGRLVRPDAVVADVVVGAGVGTTVGISVLLTGMGMTVGADDVEGTGSSVSVLFGVIVGPTVGSEVTVGGSSVTVPLLVGSPVGVGVGSEGVVVLLETGGWGSRVEEGGGAVPPVLNVRLIQGSDDVGSRVGVGVTPVPGRVKVSEIGAVVVAGSVPLVDVGSGRSPLRRVLNGSRSPPEDDDVGVTTPVGASKIPDVVVATVDVGTSDETASLVTVEFVSSDEAVEDAIEELSVSEDELLGVGSIISGGSPDVEALPSEVESAEDESAVLELVAAAASEDDVSVGVT